MRCGRAFSCVRKNASASKAHKLDNLAVRLSQSQVFVNAQTQQELQDLKYLDLWILGHQGIVKPHFQM